MNTKSYVVFASDFSIVFRMQARDAAHAAEKLPVLFRPLAAGETLASHADYCDERNAALEPMGLAPWQRQLCRQENRNVHTLA